MSGLSIVIQVLLLIARDFRLDKSDALAIFTTAGKHVIVSVKVAIVRVAADALSVVSEFRIVLKLYGRNGDFKVGVFLSWP